MQYVLCVSVMEAYLLSTGSMKPLTHASMYRSDASQRTKMVNHAGQSRLPKMPSVDHDSVPWNDNEATEIRDLL